MAQGPEVVVAGMGVDVAAPAGQDVVPVDVGVGVAGGVGGDDGIGSAFGPDFDLDLGGRGRRDDGRGGDGRRRRRSLGAVGGGRRGVGNGRGGGGLGGGGVVRGVVGGGHDWVSRWNESNRVAKAAVVPCFIDCRIIYIKKTTGGNKRRRRTGNGPEGLG